MTPFIHDEDHVNIPRTLHICPLCLYVRNGQKYCNTGHEADTRRVVMMNTVLWAQLPPTEDNLTALRRFDTMRAEHNAIRMQVARAGDIGDMEGYARLTVESAKLYNQIKADTDALDVVVRVNLLAQITPQGEPIWDGLRKGTRTP